jgi:hypothetical protein
MLIEAAAYGVLGVAFHEVIRIYRAVSEGKRPVGKGLLAWYAMSVVSLALIAAISSALITDGEFVNSVLVGWLVPSGANALFGSKAEPAESVAAIKKDTQPEIDPLNPNELEDDARDERRGPIHNWADHFFWY